MNSGAVSAVVAVVGLAFTCVALFVSYRVNKRGVSVQVYRDTALAWESKSAAQAQEIVDLRQQVADLRHAVEGRDSAAAELRGKVAVMQDTLTGKQSWEVLEAKMSEVLAQFGEIRGELRALRRGLGGGG